MTSSTNVPFARGASTTLLKGNGPGYIAGEPSDEFNPDIPDGRTFINGVVGPLTVKAYDPESGNLLGFTKSDANGEWRINGISPNDRVQVVFQNDTYENPNGELYNSFVQDWVSGVRVETPPVLMETTSKFSEDLYIYSKNYSFRKLNNGYKGNLNSGTAPAGSQIFYRNGYAVIEGTPITPEVSAPIAINVTLVGGDTISFASTIRVYPQRRATSPDTFFLNRAV